MCAVPSHGTFPMGFPQEFHSHEQAWLSPYISTLCRHHDPRETHLRSCRTKHGSTTPPRTGGLSTRKVTADQVTLLMQVIEDSFSAKKNYRSCVRRSHSCLQQCMALWAHLQVTVAQGSQTQIAPWAT